MVCKKCGNENSESAKFCSECGASLSILTDNFSVNIDPQTSLDSRTGTDDAIVPPKKKKWVIPVLIAGIVLVAVLVLILFRAFNQPRVYKYYSLSVDATAISDDDSWGYLGSEMAEVLFGSILKDCYVEIEPNKNVTLLIPDLGYRTFTPDELLSSEDDVEIDYSIEKDFICLNADGVNLVFQRVSKQEIGIYKKLLESATEIKDDSIDDVDDVFDLQESGSFADAFALPENKPAADESFVVDQYGLLTEAEKEALIGKAEEITRQYNCGIYIGVINDMRDYGYNNIEDCAEWYFDSYGLGVGDDQTGILLLMSMAERDYDIDAHGEYAHYAFTDYGKTTISDEFLDNFVESDWYGGFSDYLARCETMLQLAQEGNPVDVNR